MRAARPRNHPLRDVRGGPAANATARAFHRATGASGTGDLSITRSAADASRALAHPLPSLSLAGTGIAALTMDRLGRNPAMSEAGGASVDASTWAVHFPGNLRWSNAMQIVKGMAPYAAVAMDEVDRVGRRLQARRTEADLDKVWREEWAAMADRLAGVADEAAAEGRQITAGNNYMR